MPKLRVQIFRFVDEHFPGFVECTLVDAYGKQHSFIEKVPVITSEDLRSSSRYPRPGEFECAVEAAWSDQEGRSLLRVSTEHPWHIESTEGATSFVVLPAQVEQGHAPATA